MVSRLCENWGESDREGRIDNDAVFSMSYIRGEDREQASFLPARIDDYVGTEAAVRVIDAFAEGLNVVGLGFVRAVPAATGRPGYDPRDLLKLYTEYCIDKTCQVVTTNTSETKDSCPPP